MLNWGVIGAGTIARVFCNGMRFSNEEVCWLDLHGD